MRPLYMLLSLFIVSAKRLWNHRLLMLCLLAGLLVAVGLLSSVPLYADAVHNRLLQGELTEAGTHRPPFAFLWRYIGAWYGEITWEEYAPVDEYLTRQAAGILDLPVDQAIRHVATTKLRLFAAGDAPFASDEPLLWAAVGFITGLEEHVTLAEGAFPSPGAAGAVEVLVSHATAQLLGLQVGENYLLFALGGEGQQVPVRISGIWQPSDAADPFWFYEPDAFDEVLLTSEDNYRQQIIPLLEKPVATALWYQVYDGRRVRPASVASLLAAVSVVEARVTALLDHTTLDVSPVSALQNYGGASQFLTFILTVFSVPVLVLVLYFITLIAGMVVRRGQSEIAIMRSRGSTRRQIAGIYLLEGFIVGGLGLVGGLALGRWLAQLIGRTRTFLDPALFGLTQADPTVQPLVTVLSPTAFRYGLSGIILALFALLLPALLSAQHTIVTLRWQQARALIRPVWQRYFLDVFLLAPPFYGWYQLSQQGSIALLGQDTDPFANPLLFLVPVLFCFSLGLFLIRFFPLVLSALARTAEWLPGTTLLLTLRQLARSAAQYTGPLLLLSLTVSLASFAASMAVTLDGHLQEQIYYQVGADLSLAELGENTETSDQPSLLGQEQLRATLPGDSQEPRWLFLPVSEHLRVTGVEQAVRVGDYSATANIGGRQQTGRLLAIDRLEFANVAYFRPDFAQNESLGGVMNRLAVAPDRILVSRDFMSRRSLVVGDPLRLTIGAAGEYADIEFNIAGPLDLFPTQYPQDGPFFVANLDYVHQGLGGTLPYNVWLKTDSAVSTTTIVDGLRRLGLTVVAAQDARSLISAAQTRPERQGLFGLLSVGFLAAAALTVLGFLVYAIVSFQQRFIELGMLRAIGLSVWQMAAYLAGEQAALILTGVGLGTGLGVWASLLFIPFFQIGSDKTALVPPYLVQIAWAQLGTIYAVYAAMFVVAVLVLIVLLIRMRVFEAVKLGETV